MYQNKSLTLFQIRFIPVEEIGAFLPVEMRQSEI